MDGVEIEKNGETPQFNISVDKANEYLYNFRFMREKFLCPERYSRRKECQS